MEREQLVGTWTLVSLESRRSDGAVIYPYGRDALGRLIYTADGHMAGFVMRAGRRPFAEADLGGGTTEEKAAAAETFLAYSGRYAVRGDRVIHDVDLSLFPNWMGGTRERVFEVRGNTLVLTTPPLLVGGAEVTTTIVWRRARSTGSG